MGSGVSKQLGKKHRFRTTASLVNTLQVEHKSSQRRLEAEEDVPLKRCLKITDTRSAWEELRLGRVADVRNLPKKTVRFVEAEAKGADELPGAKIPFDIPRHSDTQIRDDDLCSICGVYTYGELFPCRVCTRVYHGGCVRLFYRCRWDESKSRVHKAMKSVTGWSCYHCDDLASLLTEDDMLTLTQNFDHCDTNQDSVVTIEEYVKYKRKKFKEHTGNSFSTTEEEDERYKFRLMADQGGDSPSVTWWAFLNNEAIKLLQKRPKGELVKLLSEKEIQRSRETFRFLDRDDNGAICYSEATEAFSIWYRNFYHDRFSPDQRATLDNHVQTNAKLIMEADANHTGTVTWQEYLEDQAVYILAARPNSEIFTDD